MKRIHRRTTLRNPLFPTSLQNADGEFFVRFSKAGTLTLEVVLTEFLNPASFHLVLALPAVKVFPEAVAPDIEIVLERK